MSHRMVGYQNRFGPYLSFRSAIGRDQSIIEQIQDETEKKPNCNIETCTAQYS